MARYLDVHPDNPQPRLLGQIADALRDDQLIAYPTDSGYALGSRLGNRDGRDRILRIRGLDDRHHFTLMCRDFSQLGQLVHVDNAAFRAIKAATPGPYTFILEASKEVPRRLSHPSRKTIGLRVPEHKTLQCLLELHGAPLLATTLIPRGVTEPLNDAQEIRDLMEHELAAVVDAGACHQEPTTVIDLTPMGDGGDALVTRQGRGDITKLGL